MIYAVKISEDGAMQIYADARIDLPFADMIKINIGHDAQAHFPFTAEVVLMKGSMFVTDYVVPEWTEYMDVNEFGRIVYYHVPMTKVSAFVEQYAKV